MKDRGRTWKPSAGSWQQIPGTIWPVAMLKFMLNMLREDPSAVGFVSATLSVTGALETQPLRDMRCQVMEPLAVTH